MLNKPANQYIPPTTDKAQLALWQRVNWLLEEIARMNKRLEGLGTGEQAKAIGDLRVQIAAVQDAQTEAQTFVGQGQASFNATGASLAASGDGLSITGTTGAGTINVDNPTALRAAADAAEASSVGAHTITLLKLTGGGTDGSITWNADGVITAFVDPT